MAAKRGSPHKRSCYLSPRADRAAPALSSHLVTTSASGIPSAWLSLALAPPLGHGGPCIAARLRASPEDFVVDEQLGFEPSGGGQHVLLRVRKRNANTEWVQRELARQAGCKPMDVGYAGLKDRNAVTTQYFTVPRGRRTVESWLEIVAPDYQVLTAVAHDRKLPRGALASNRFTITLRDVTGDLASVAARLTALADLGVPNYFGPQRFGRDAGNLRSAVDGRAPRARDQHGFALSAARALLFNMVLAERVLDGSWCQLHVGDVANLDDSGSVFRVPAVDAALLERVAQLDIHPTGPLWGEGEPLTEGVVREREAAVAARYPSVLQLLATDRVKASRRALRLAVRELAHDWLDATTLRVSFALTAGSFATTVLRELVATERDGD